MSKRLKLKNYLTSLQGIENIIAAMKNLSLLEIGKLSGFINTQGQVADVITKAAADFMTFNPIDLSFVKERPAVYILIGSERGFCGGFNELVINKFLEFAMVNTENAKITPNIIVMGHKLALKMSESKFIFESVTGPSAVNEIQAVVLSLIKTLTSKESNEKLYPNNWVIVSNIEIQNILQTTIIRPIDEFINQKSNHVFSYPPLLNLKPNHFLMEIFYQYFFAILHQILYKSFMAENHQRFLHMDNAIRWLQKRSEGLFLNYNQLRQEEITEEIEIILLSIKAMLNANWFKGLAMID